MTKKFVINTEAAIYREGKWLLGVRSKDESEAAGLLSFVGGTIDNSDNSPSNALENALKREVMEEVGVEVEIVDFVNDTFFVSKKGNNVINAVFLCKIISGDPIITATEELDELLWLSTEEVLKYENVPSWLCDSVKIADALVSGKLS